MEAKSMPFQALKVVLIYVHDITYGLWSNTKKLHKYTLFFYKKPAYKKLVLGDFSA